MPRSRPVGTLARLVVVALAGLVLALAGIQSVREDALPSWIPEQVGGLTIRAGYASELSVTRDEAVAYARMRVFIADPSGLPEPDVFPVRVTGRVPPEQPVPLGPSGKIELRDVATEPAWLVTWRDFDIGLRDSPPTRTGALVDVVCFVNGETGRFLYPITFMPLGDS